jgi:hypothetical protein
LHGSHRRELQLSVGKTPGFYSVVSAKKAYKFIVPLPENDLFEIFEAIAGNATQPIVHSTVSIAISANQTVIWYDHSEDGIDTTFVQRTTVVWGDANATNGCPPSKPSCTNAEDILYEGDVLDLASSIDIPRNNATHHFDYGDIIYANYPLVVSRWVEADLPGTNQSLAEAVEVVEASGMFWGTGFISPVGPSFSTATESFGLVKMFLISADNDNIVKFPNGSNSTLQAGQSLSFDVNVGTVVTTSKKCLAHLVTADTSGYEMRWLSLLPNAVWSDEYIAPVGDETGSKSCVTTCSYSLCSPNAIYRHECSLAQSLHSGYLGCVYYDWIRWKTQKPDYSHCPQFNRPLAMRRSLLCKPVSWE